jgi:hypothetical protein
MNNLLSFGFSNPINIKYKKLGGEKMEKNKTSIRQKAQAYEPVTTKNISELKEFSSEEEITEVEYHDKTGKPFIVNEINVNGEKYRVPVSVIADIKAIQEENPDVIRFKVKKAGTGLQTKYTTIALD